MFDDSSSSEDNINLPSQSYKPKPWDYKQNGLKRNCNKMVDEGSLKF